jgi:short chain dehydrogenase
VRSRVARSAAFARVLTGVSTGAIDTLGWHLGVRSTLGETAGMIRTDHDDPNALEFRAEVVAIVTGGSSEHGRDVARALTRWGWAIVIVYLEHQRAAEATVDEILAAGGDVVAVRADPADDLDVQRLFAETTAAFAGVDVVVHTTSGSASLLYQYAARHIRSHGAIVSTSATGRVAPSVARQLSKRGISIGRAPPEEMLSFLDSWRQRATD